MVEPNQPEQFAAAEPMARKRAGKMPGSPGHGRPAPDRVDAEEIHRPERRCFVNLMAVSRSVARRAMSGSAVSGWLARGWRP